VRNESIIGWTRKGHNLPASIPREKGLSVSWTNGNGMSNWGPFDGGSNFGPMNSGSNMGPFTGGQNMGPFNGGL
jgi:hypothetical protein